MSNNQFSIDSVRKIMAVTAEIAASKHSDLVHCIVAGLIRGCVKIDPNLKGDATEVRIHPRLYAEIMSMYEIRGATLIACTLSGFSTICGINLIQDPTVTHETWSASKELVEEALQQIKATPNLEFLVLPPVETVETPALKP